MTGMISGTVSAQTWTNPTRLSLNGKQGVFFDKESEYILIAQLMTREDLIVENYGLNKVVEDQGLQIDGLNSALKLREEEVAILEHDKRILDNSRDHYKQEAESNLKAYNRADKARKRNRRWYLLLGFTSGVLGTTYLTR